MRIKLTTLHGPAGREWYSFDRYPVRVGRKLDNDVAIADPSVSRYHCEITLRKGDVWVVDLGSSNGISVNDERTIERKLSNGDELTVGLVRFRIEADEAQSHISNSGAPPVKLSRMHTVVLQPGNSAWLPQIRQESGRAERDLRVLLELARALQARLPVQEIVQRLMDLLERALPFECGTLLLLDPLAGRELATTKLPDDHEVEFDFTPGLEGRGMLSGRTITAPLVVNRTILGAVSVRSDGVSEFDSDHLHLVAAAASTAAAAIENSRREQQLAAKADLLDRERSWEADIAGGSAHAELIRRRVEAMAASAAPVLIVGPPGIGKDGVGVAIHTRSAFSEGPYVLGRVLGRDPETLARLMFGVASGSEVQQGWFDQAEGGTLFLDRIEGLDWELQQRFYALLETGEYAREGDASVARARCRILCSAGENIESLVAAGEFYSELYLRLRGLLIEMPGLRERPSDIGEMAHILATSFSKRSGRVFDGISEAAQVALTLYEWPDNVRELESVIRTAELRRTTTKIELEDLPAEVAEALDPDAPGGYHHEVREARRQIIRTAMEKARGSYSAAADLLRINRTYLHRLIRNLDLRDELANRFGRE